MYCMQHVIIGSRARLHFKKTGNEHLHIKRFVRMNFSIKRCCLNKIASFSLTKQLMVYPNYTFDYTDTYSNIAPICSDISLVFLFSFCIFEATFFML